jgi:hypothetical protein
MHAIKGIIAGFVFFGSAALADNNSYFASLQAKVGVATIADVCISHLPNFEGTANALARMNADQKTDSVWVLGGGALTVSLHSDQTRLACIATIAETTQTHVIIDLLELFEVKFKSYQTKVHNGVPTVFFETPNGQAAVMVLPGPKGTKATTVMVQPKPN